MPLAGRRALLLHQGSLTGPVSSDLPGVLVSPSSSVRFRAAFFFWVFFLGGFFLWGRGFCFFGLCWGFGVCMCFCVGGLVLVLVFWVWGGGLFWVWGFFFFRTARPDVISLLQTPQLGCVWDMSQGVGGGGGGASECVQCPRTLFTLHSRLRKPWFK